MSYTYKKAEVYLA